MTVQKDLPSKVFLIRK